MIDVEEFNCPQCSAAALRVASTPESEELGYAMVECGECKTRFEVARDGDGVPSLIPF